MTTAAEITWDDSVLPFQLDNADVRGRVARLDGVLGDVLRQHNYPPQIEALVAEATLLTAMIGQTVKLRWKLSLQIRGKGAARLIATDYYGPAEEGEPGRIRAYASFDADALDPEGTPFAQIGEGYFAVMLDQGAGMTPYQGFTPIEGTSLSACAETYFAQSEQLPTRFAVTFGKSQEPGQDARWRAGGVMLQHMPQVGGTVAAEAGSGSGGLLTHADILGGAEAENWNRVNILLDTVEELELVGPTVTPTELLVRLFSEEEPRVFDATSVRFGCSCSAEKVRNTMSIYSQKDISKMTTADGLVTADCQFCGAHYEFDPKQLGFEAEGADGLVPGSKAALAKAAQADGAEDGDA
ncbi:MAG: Hsp33 family molecular chaperone HslO [Candidatus Saccharibacteria bacterium]|nr:Hsp33 family molecular chaperone HslO [Pseudorhodobacter sp.]